MSAVRLLRPSSPVGCHAHEAEGENSGGGWFGGDGSHENQFCARMAVTLLGLKR